MSLNSEANKGGACAGGCAAGASQAPRVLQLHAVHWLAREGAPLATATLRLRLTLSASAVTAACDAASGAEQSLLLAP